LVALFHVTETLGISAHFAQLIDGIAVSDGQALLEQSVLGVSERQLPGNFQSLREVFERFPGVTQPVITLPNMTVSDSDTPGVTSVLRVLPQILLDFQFFPKAGESAIKIFFVVCEAHTEIVEIYCITVLNISVIWTKSKHGFIRDDSSSIAFRLLAGIPGPIEIQVPL